MSAWIRKNPFTTIDPKTEMKTAAVREAWLNVTTMSRVLAIILVLSSGSLVAQSVPEHSSASLLANVIDRNGRTVQDLTQDNFQVKVNGHPAVT